MPTALAARADKRKHSRKCEAEREEGTDNHWPVERRLEPVLTVTKAGLPAKPTIVVLPGQ